MSYFHYKLIAYRIFLLAKFSTHLVIVLNYLCWLQSQIQVIYLIHRATSTSLPWHEPIAVLLDFFKTWYYSKHDGRTLTVHVHLACVGFGSVAAGHGAYNCLGNIFPEGRNVVSCNKVFSQQMWWLLLLWHSMTHRLSPWVWCVCPLWLWTSWMGSIPCMVSCPLHGCVQGCVGLQLCGYYCVLFTDNIWDMIWHDMTRYDTIWLGVITVWWDVMRYDKVWQSMTGYD